MKNVKYSMSKADKKEIRSKVEKAIYPALTSISLIESKKTQKLVKKFAKEISSVILDQLKKKLKSEIKPKKRAVAKKVKSATK